MKISYAITVCNEFVEIQKLVLFLLDHKRTEDEIIINDEVKNSDRMKHIKELVDEFMDKQKDLKELEEELQKNKDKITPGEIGEA